MTLARLLPWRIAAELPTLPRRLLGQLASDADKLGVDLRRQRAHAGNAAHSDQQSDQGVLDQVLAGILMNQIAK